jgi:hypothetical protein
MILVMFNRVLTTGALAFGAGLTASVLIRKVLQQRRGRSAKGHSFPGDRDFTPEQIAMLAVIRRQIAATDPIPGEA